MAGVGKSKSFYFYSENNKLMLKTMKKSEMEVFFDEDFIVGYYFHLSRSPNSILTKYLGIYEVKVNNNSPIYFFVTENLFGTDFLEAKNIYDLKGSTFARRTNVTVDQ